MRSVLTLFFVLVLIPGLAACGDKGDSGGGGGGGFNTGTDTNTGNDTGGGTSDADVSSGDPDTSDVPEPDDTTPTTDVGADVLDDADTHDEPKDTLSDGGIEDVEEEDVPLGAADTDTFILLTEIPCETPSDCAGEDYFSYPLSCDGAIGPKLLAVPECFDGFCGEGVQHTDCCMATSDCAEFMPLTPCESAQCVDNVCQVEPVEGCCESNADCESLGDGCCTSALCNTDNTCDVNVLEGCCAESADCDDNVAITNDTCTEACVADGCVNSATGCGNSTFYLNKDFDDGTVQLLSVSDSAPGDSVSIQTVKGNAVSPKYALYFGEPTCETYYNGPMTDCMPDDLFATESTPVELKLETTQFALSAESGSYLSFWLKMSAEPPVSVDFGDGIVLLDTDYLSVSVTSSSGTEVVWKSTDPDALGEENTTHGDWVHQAANLSSYAGQAIVITFEFSTDGSGNYNITPGGDPYIGVYLDDLRVTSTCEEESCAGAGEACANDGNGCTQDICTPYAIGGGGVCAYPTASPGQDCMGCGVAADCGSDPCLNYACNEGICSATVDASCCEISSTFPEVVQGSAAVEGFEAGSLNGWLIDDPYPGDNIGWQVTPVLTYEGTFSLYFGDPTTFNYVAEPANPSVATIWTPIFEVPAESFQVPMASFWLWMSTEYDGATETPDPSESYDRLSIHLQPAGIGDTVEVWNSVTTVSNSTGGKWVQVGVDLSGHEGTDARLGFKFDSGDAPGFAVGNNAGGVRIDNLTVAAACGENPCLSASDCTDPDPCTLEYCDLGTCVSYVEDENCCFVDEDCQDDNECTVNECVDGTCNNYYDDSSATKLNCCPEDDAAWIGEYHATFEEGDDDFTTIDETVPVVWSIADDFGANGSARSYNFANPASGNYTNPAGGKSSGDLVSAPIHVPPLTKGNPYAEFMLYMETEWDGLDPADFVGVLHIDELTVAVATDVTGDGIIDLDSAELWWTSEYLENTTRGEWVHTRVDLDAFRGEEIQLVFSFTTFDGNANAFAGPFVDDVTFGTTCLTDQAVQCLYGGDCSAANDCKEAVCSDQFKCVQVPKDTPECCEPFTPPDLTLNFEGANEGWVNTACEPDAGTDDPDSVWQITDQEAAAGIPPKDGDSLLYFGNGENYGGAYASCDVISSPPFELLDGVPWSLRFWLWLDIGKPVPCAGAEPTWSDTFNIALVNVDTGEESVIWYKLEDAECADFGYWKSYEMDLTPWAGQTLQLRFDFDSFDGLENGGKGIGVDAVEFTKGCAEIP